MMKNSIKELTEGMQRLCAVANRIVAHEGEVSAIERDLLMEELRRIYSVAIRMEVGGSLPAAAAPRPDEEILSSTVMATMAAMAVPEPVVAAVPEPQPEPEPEVAPEPEVVPEPVAEPVVAPEPEPVAAPEPAPVEAPQASALNSHSASLMEDLEANGNSLLFDEIIVESKMNEPAPEPTPEPEPAPVETPHASPAPDPVVAAGGQASLLDYLKRPVEEQPTVRTLGDTLGAQSAVSGQQSAVSSQHKVNDLRTVININDKFSFMSELFHNNMKAYNDFILRLNAIDNRDEALLCVNETAAQYRWDEGSLAVKTFYSVFDKKF